MAIWEEGGWDQRIEATGLCSRLGSPIATQILFPELTVRQEEGARRLSITRSTGRTRSAGSGGFPRRRRSATGARRSARGARPARRWSGSARRPAAERARPGRGRGSHVAGWAFRETRLLRGRSSFGPAHSAVTFVVSRLQADWLGCFFRTRPPIGNSYSYSREAVKARPT